MMLTLLVQAALRSSLLTLGLWLALRAMRAANRHTEMAVWRLALAASCAMPLLMQWHPLPAATITAPADALRQSLATLPIINVSVQAAPDAVPVKLDWSAAFTAAYATVAALLLARLIVGLWRTWTLSRAAAPVQGTWAGANSVRISNRLRVPVTFGTTIILPEAAAAWSPEQLLAVMTHEAAHVAHADFAVLLVSAVHRAVFWFNPAAWWLHRELCQLAEARSDEAALRSIPNRITYAEILLGIASHAHAVPAGVPMARPVTINRRIGQILRATSPEAPMTPRKYLFVATGVALPAVLAAAIMTQNAPTAAATPSDGAQAAATINPGLLNGYVGTYKLGPADIFTITRSGDHLKAQLTGQPALDIFPESNTNFFYKAVRAQITFLTGADGDATALILHQNGLDTKAARVTEAEAAAATAALSARVAQNTAQPGSEAALRRTIDAQLKGAPDYADMTAKMASAVRAQFTPIHQSMQQLGEVQSVKFQGVTPKGWDLYDVRFTNGDTQWRITLDGKGKIAGMLFQAAP